MVGMVLKFRFVSTLVGTVIVALKLVTFLTKLLKY